METYIVHCERIPFLWSRCRIFLLQDESIVSSISQEQTEITHHNWTTQSQFRNLPLINLLIDSTGSEESIYEARSSLSVSMNAVEARDTVSYNRTDERVRKPTEPSLVDLLKDSIRCRGGRDEKHQWLRSGRSEQDVRRSLKIARLTVQTSSSTLARKEEDDWELKVERQRRVRYLLRANWAHNDYSWYLDWNHWPWGSCHFAEFFYFSS